jgi:hypothetical protein
MDLLSQRVARWAVACVLGATAFVAPAASGEATACAGEGARAALVVDTGDGVHNLCVALPDEQVSGIELIVLAAEQHGLSYRLGYGGDAVCMLAGVGTSGDDCFERYPDFWGYWRGDGGGGWSWSGSGAGSTVVGDGDVEGWSWGSGNNGDSHPRPPETAFASVCAPGPATRRGSGDPEDRTAGDASEGPRQSASRSQTALESEAPRPAGSPATDATDDGTPRQGGDDGTRGAKRGTGRPMTKRGPESPRPVAVKPSLDGGTPVAAAESDRANSPPAAGLAAVAVALGLGFAGAHVARRRDRSRG